MCSLNERIALYEKQVKTSKELKQYVFPAIPPDKPDD